VNVIWNIARNFAVSDFWYASAPCQTWPNRGFVHTGSSDGHINNDNSELYDIQTIFNCLVEQGISWGVYHDTFYTPSFTHLQFPKLDLHPLNFHPFTKFKNLCSAPANSPADKKIPSYSFLEPRFITELVGIKLHHPEDYHPPHNVCIGEQFLADVYNAVRQSPYRDKILLVITFDEHGGCYDHYPPPTGSVAPIPGSVSRYGNFNFNRFGVRVPAILVSSYVQPGTVFRAAAKATPYDHTSILATLRDWKNLASNPKHKFLPSPRIAQAPTLYPVLTLSDQNKNSNWPSIVSTCTVGSTDAELLSQPVNDLQMSILIAIANRRNQGQHVGKAMSDLMRERIKTQHDAIDFMGPERLLATELDGLKPQP
jgi:phospholipase C